MVNITKYTPILKCKAAEIEALSGFTDMQRDSILPLFEFVLPSISEKEEKADVTPEDKLMKKSAFNIPQDILMNWGDGRLFFVDFTLLFPEILSKSFANVFCRNSALLHLDFIPVINLTACSEEYKRHMVDLSAEYSSSKICIRINSVEIQDFNNVNFFLKQFISEYKFDRRHISLLVDLKEHVSIEAYDVAISNIQKINVISLFDNLILAGGAFPEDMSQYKQHAEDNHQIRDDWNGWLSHLSKSLERVPNFADYTIRYPIFNEKIMNFSSTATIKYTLPDKWIFFKGRVRKYEDYLASAAVLRTQPEYMQFGPHFSAGDKYFEEKGIYFTEYISQKNENPDKKIGGTGNTKEWLRAGINHHIAVVVDQLANLHG